MSIMEGFLLPTVGGIYTGKYTERAPHIVPAGKLTYTGETAINCFYSLKRPQSPEAVRRFRATLQPDAGEMRVFYSKAYDPHRKWAMNMVHGKRGEPSYPAGELLNPKPKSLYQQRMADKKEVLYHSRIRQPLGRSHDQRVHLPAELDTNKVRFGVKTLKDGSAGELVSPDRTYQELDQEYDAAHHLYVTSHKSFSASEQINRRYKVPPYRAKSCFGIHTPHHNDGRHVRKTMKWITNIQDEKATPIAHKRLDDFRERTQHQLGKTLDPIKDTLNVPDDHTFGILHKPDDYGAGDLLHGRSPGHYLRGRERIRGILAAIRQNLKKANYHNFTGLLHAFEFYDKENLGKITINGLRDACLQFNLPVEPELLVQLMDCCDINRDGLIDYTEFANFLNWKDQFPAEFPPAGAYNSNCSFPDGADERPKDGPASGQGRGSGVESGPVSAVSTPRRLQNQIDKAITDQRTSSSMINAVVGGISTAGYRRYGTPTIRSDLSAPFIKRVSNLKNYGDESDALGLISPSLFSQYGVNERDFLGPRHRDELRSIYENIGVAMTGETFDQIYNKAAMMHPKGHVSVESFRGVLDELNEARHQPC